MVGIFLFVQSNGLKKIKNSECVAKIFFVILKELKVETMDKYWAFEKKSAF